jgi:DNA modification methylase
VVDKDGVIIVGHGRWLAYKKYPEGIKEPWITRADDLTPQQVKAYRLADNKLNESDWDMDLVVEELKGLDDDMFDLTGFDKDFLLDNWTKEEMMNSLKDDFIIPPFSIFDTKRNYWLDRKRKWIKLIGDSGEGRERDLLGGFLDLARRLGAKLTGTSIFDPVLAEICYRWFCPDNGLVIDPFSGGSTRGLVATILGREYYGIDLSKKQVEANRKIATDLKQSPNWFVGDSKNIDKIIPQNIKADFIFTCPPYYNLEKYEDGEGDLSMCKTYKEFLILYEDIILRTIKRLKNNRFACFVVANIRDKDGKIRNFVNDTISIFERNGLCFYNDIILANSLVSAGVRARGHFENRKVVRVHQNILVFFKGSLGGIKKSINNIPKVERLHSNIVVFYKGNIGDIKVNFKQLKQIDETDFL